MLYGRNLVSTGARSSARPLACDVPRQTGGMHPFAAKSFCPVSQIWHEVEHERIEATMGSTHQAIVNALCEAGYVVTRAQIVGAGGGRWYHRQVVVSMS